MSRFGASPPPQRNLLSGMLREARHQPMLTRNEEVELARRSQEGDLAAAGRLITSHLRFVIKIAKRYRSYGLPMTDLIQAGTVGLIQAVRRFSPERNVRLATYAMWWIRAAIQDYVMRSWSLVRVGTTAAQKSLFFTLRRLKAEIQEGADSLGEESLKVLKALTQRSGMKMSDALAVASRLAGRDTSLNVPLNQNGAGAPEWIESLQDGRPTPEETVAVISEQRFLNGVLDKALSMLPPREQMIIRKRYLAEAASTFEALAGELGISKERVRQLEARALAELRGMLAPAMGETLAPQPNR